MLHYMLLVAIVATIGLLYQGRRANSRDRRYHSESEKIHDMTQQRAKIVADVEKERARQNVRHEGGYYSY